MTTIVVEERGTHFYIIYAHTLYTIGPHWHKEKKTTKQIRASGGKKKNYHLNLQTSSYIYLYVAYGRAAPVEKRTPCHWI